MNKYRIEYISSAHEQIPIVIMEMERPRFTSREFKIIKREAMWLAKDCFDGFCRAKVLLNGKKIFQYTFISDELDINQLVMNTHIYTAWPNGGYHSMRIVKEA